MLFFVLFLTPFSPSPREVSKPLIPLGKAGVLLVQILTLLCSGMVRAHCPLSSRASSEFETANILALVQSHNTCSCKVDPNHVESECSMWVSLNIPCECSVLWKVYNLHNECILLYIITSKLPVTSNSLLISGNKTSILLRHNDIWKHCTMLKLTSTSSSEGFSCNGV